MGLFIAKFMTVNQRVAGSSPAAGAKPGKFRVLFMYFIYILYSESSDQYYLGYSNDPHRRLIEHNTSSNNTFTSKHRPWILKMILECSTNEHEAINMERFIKKQKSRKLIENICNPGFGLTGKLAQLVRVPDIRD